MIKKLFNFIRRKFLKTPPVVRQKLPSFEILDLDDAPHLINTGFRILDGPFKNVVFCIIKVLPKESEDKSYLIIQCNYEVIESTRPAEELETDPEFQNTVQLIVSNILEDNSLEINPTNNPWLIDLQ